MLKDIVTLTKNLIKIPSVTTNQKELAKAIDLVKKELNGFNFKYFDKKGYPSLLFYNTPALPKKFKIILNAHLDVVPGKKRQFVPFEKNGRLYGRGAFDMKGGAACEILVFKELAKKLSYPLGLQIVTDEEIGGFWGTKYQIEQGVRAEFALAGDSTNFKIDNKCKGIIWLRIVASGKTAHGAYPWQGQNAVIRLIKVVSKILDKYPIPKKEAWQTTFNLSWIKTPNETVNRVPDTAEAQFDIRYTPELMKKYMSRKAKSDIKYAIQNFVNTEIKPLVPSDFQVTVLEAEPSQFTKKNNPFVKTLQKAAREIIKQPLQFQSQHGGTDLRHFEQVGTPAVAFSPAGEGLHSDIEWVEITSLSKYYQILKTFLMLTN